MYKNNKKVTAKTGPDKMAFSIIEILV